MKKILLATTMLASVAGYVQGQSGQRYTFVAVLNHPNAQQARLALDQLLEWTVRDTRAPNLKTP